MNTTTENHESDARLPGDPVPLLNALLEAERAGAKVLAVFLADYPVGTPVWTALKAVQADESRNCAVLIHLLRYVDGDASTATGAFLERALIVKGKAQRLEFLNRGQKWVARTIQRALPNIVDRHVRRGLEEMYESHVANINRCDEVLATIRGNSH